jgi:hypothetical protein
MQHYRGICKGMQGWTFPVQLRQSMKKLILIAVPILLILIGCTTDGNPLATLTPTTQSAAPLSETPRNNVEKLTPTVTAKPKPTGIVKIPPVNPLTGLPPDDPQKLNRRPVLVKVENLPRENRPQYGLTFADIVYEYYTEFGSTRFAALFYGQDSEKVGPIRSARWFDINLMQMYRPVFVFGSAYGELMKYLGEQDFADRLIIEGPQSEPAVYRFEPESNNFLMVNTSQLAQLIDRWGIDNQAVDLSGMTFSEKAPSGGSKGNEVVVRFSSAIYNRWQYDQEQKRYLRFVDAINDPDWINPAYVQHIDRLTGKPITADNVLVVIAEYTMLVKTAEAEVTDVALTGKGRAYLARNGQVYQVYWQRTQSDAVLTLVGEDGKPFPFKPGQTWVEVIGTTSWINQKEEYWTFWNSLP